SCVTDAAVDVTYGSSATTAGADSLGWGIRTCPLSPGRGRAGRRCDDDELTSSCGERLGRTYAAVGGSDGGRGGDGARVDGGLGEGWADHWSPRRRVRRDRAGVPAVGRLRVVLLCVERRAREWLDRLDARWRRSGGDAAQRAV